MRLHRVSQGSALFSDRFRYELLHHSRGLWIDCDLLCLKPLPVDARLYLRLGEGLV